MSSVEKITDAVEETREQKTPLRILEGMPWSFESRAENESRERDSEIRYAMLNIPAPCVLDCEKCCRVDERDKLRHENTPQLTLEEQINFLNLAQAIGARALVIIGEGEPTQPKDWELRYKPIIEHWSKAGKERNISAGVVLFTSAFFITQEQAEFCRDNKVTLIISLDTLDNDKYREMYGVEKKDKFGRIITKVVAGEKTGVHKSWEAPADRIKQNIEMLTDIYKDTGKTLDDGRNVTRLGINTTIQLKNEDELGSLKKFADEHEMFYVANYIMPQGKAAKDKNNERYAHFIKLVGSEENWERHKVLAEEYSDSGGHSSIKEGVCNYFADGVACDSRGYILTCGYASATAHESENIRNIKSPEELLWTQQRNRRAYRLWCEEIGRERPDDSVPSCPLRDKDYEGFVKWLEKERMNFRFIARGNKKERENIVRQWQRESINP